MTLFAQIVICSLCIFVENTNSNEIESVVKRVCGERNNTLEGGKAPLPFDSCCRPCESEDICFEKRTCCPEKYENKSENVTKQLCLPSVSHNKLFKDSRQFPRYFVRAKCPEHYQEELTRRKCEETEPESVLDIPFVSSKDGSVVYKNRHCAACFGELDILPWKMLIEWYCIKSIYWDDEGNKVSFNQTSLLNALLKRCTVPFIRPKITSRKHTFCYEDDRIISSCPKANLLGSVFQNSIYDELKEKCENDKSALIFVRGRSRFGYSNVYCYLCNKGNEATWTCNNEEPFKVASDFLIILRTESFKDEITDETQKCNQYDYHDMFFDVCRILRCPIFRFAKQGKCVSPMYQRLSKLNYKFDFKLSSTDQDPKNEDEIQAFVKLLPNLLRNVLQFQKCDICSMRVLDEHHKTSITEIYTSFIFITTSECVEEKVLSTATTLQDNQMIDKYEVIKWKQISFKVEYIPSEEMYRNLSQNAETMYHFGKSRCQYLHSSRFENCAKICLSNEEFKKIENKSDAGKVAVAKLRNGDFEICVSDFEAMTNAKVFGSVNTFVVLSIFSSAMVLLL